MAKNIPRTGKRVRPKTAVRGKRYLCARCRKRSPRPVTAPAPWYCPKCLGATPASPPRVPHEHPELGADGAV